MATTRSVVSAIAPAAVGSAGAVEMRVPGLAAVVRASARRLARAAARTASASPLLRSVRNSFKPAFGLVTNPTAPAAIACIVVSQPRSVKVEHITTGVGRSAMTLRRKLMPSMRGISTSSTITSGHRAAMRVQANSGSAALPITSMPEAASISVRCLRTTAESSITNAVTVMSGFYLRGWPRRMSTSPVASRSVTVRGKLSPTSTPWSWKP